MKTHNDRHREERSDVAIHGLPRFARHDNPRRHREERSDVAIHGLLICACGDTLLIPLESTLT